jgi:hypothetical protein
MIYIEIMDALKNEPRPGGLSKLMRILNSTLLAGHFNAVDKVLKIADPRELSVRASIALLTVTLSGTDQGLPSRLGFFQRTLEHFESIGENDIRGLLGGLGPLPAKYTEIQ